MERATGHTNPPVEGGLGATAPGLRGPTTAPRGGPAGYHTPRESEGRPTRRDKRRPWVPGAPIHPPRGATRLDRARGAIGGGGGPAGSTRAAEAQLDAGGGINGAAYFGVRIAN